MTASPSSREEKSTLASLAASREGSADGSTAKVGLDFRDGWCVTQEGGQR
jgi:hypothetical protein